MVSFIDFETIVRIPYPLAHLVEQAAGLKGRGTGFHGKLQLYKNTVYLTVSQSPRDLQAFQQKDVSAWPGCINRVLQSTLR